MTRNHITNPSFEAGIDGEAIQDAQLDWVTQPEPGEDDPPPQAAFGVAYMRVTAPQPGAGWQGADTPVGPGIDLTLTFYLRGVAGRRVIARLYERTPQGDTEVVGRDIAALADGRWERHHLTWTGYTPDPRIVFLRIVSADGGPYTFDLDALQLELGTTTDYFDGDSYGCYWEGPEHASTSIREVERPIIAIADGTCADQICVAARPDPVTGEIADPTCYGRRLMVIVPQRHIDLSAGAGGRCDGQGWLDLGIPVAAFDDFAVFPNDEPDPAKTYIAAHEATGSSVTGPAAGAFRRTWATVVAPADYPITPDADHPGGLLWKRAAYATAGFVIDNVPAAGAVQMDGVSVDLQRLQPGSPQPPPYCAPRKLNVILLPRRLNLIPNPSFEVSTRHWTATGVGALSAVTEHPDPRTPTAAQMEGLTPAEIADLTGQLLAHTITPRFGTKFGLLTLSGLGRATAGIGVNGMTPGDTYSMSGYLYLKKPVQNLQLEVAGFAGESILEIEDSSNYPYSTGRYDEIPYGGGSNETPYDTGPYGGCAHTRGTSLRSGWKTSGPLTGQASWSTALEPVTSEPDELTVPREAHPRARWGIDPETLPPPPEESAHPDCVPYGGGEESPYPYGRWVRFWLTGVAETTTGTLTIAVNGDDGGALGIDGLLLESGSALGEYFDGDCGADYRWEYVGDTYARGESRSFYYPGLGSRREDVAGGSVQGVRELIAEYLPFGEPFEVARITTLPS